jgi:lysophospholipase L1-like esterase
MVWSRGARIGIGLLIVATLAGAAWAVVSRPAGRSYYDTRRIVILAHARQASPPVVILGDSIVDMADLPQLCGKEVLNAGVSGARTEAVERLSREVLAIGKPDLVIVAVGLNDAHRDVRTSDADFIDKYRAIVARARMAGADVRVTTIPPVGPAEMGRAGEFDRERIAALNAQIRRIGVPVIDIYSALAGPRGMTPVVNTEDGVHPNARGYGVWKHELAKACAT